VRKLAHETQLIVRVAIEDERGEAAVAVLGIMDGRFDGRHQSIVAAVAVEGREPREALGVVAETDLAVGLVKAAIVVTNSPSRLVSKPVRGITLNMP